MKSGKPLMLSAYRPEPLPSHVPAPAQHTLRPLRVLLVEDNSDDAWAIQRQLERGGYRPQVLRVQDGVGLQAALDAGAWDLVIAADSVPGISDIDVVRQVRASDVDVPCLLVSATISDASAIAAMRLGANDYLPKNNPSRLLPAAERELRASSTRLERRRAEQSLAASEERMRLILEQALDAIVMFAADGHITDWNDRAAVLFGRTRAEALGSGFSDIVLAPRWHAAFTDALRETFHAAGAVFTLRRRMELTGHHGDGSLLAIEVTLIPVPSSTGLSFCAFVRDLSERRAAEAKRASLENQLRQSQKMEAIGKLAGGIAHDFNNLLTVIQGQASLLDARLLAAEDQPTAVNAIVDASERAAELTRQLLAFSRQQVVRLTPVDLNELVADLGKLLGRLIGAGVELHTQLAPGTVGIEADPSMIEQVLMNLAVNARDAMPRGGPLVVSTSVVQAVPPPAALAAGSGAGPFARLSVRDSGTGISAEHLPHIFEPFFTTKDKARSTGLGLATVFGIVEQHHGWIEVESEEGRGSAFHVFLPRRRSAPRSARPAPDAPTLPRGSECILLVEDEHAVREMMRDVLVRQGFTVLEAGSGQEALARWAAAADRIDLVVTDIVMRDGLMGPELIERLRQERPSLKAVFTSGYSSESDRVSVTLHEGVNFVQKPFRPATLVRVVREHLDRP